MSGAGHELPEGLISIKFEWIVTFFVKDRYQTIDGIARII